MARCNSAVSSTNDTALVSIKITITSKRFNAKKFPWRALVVVVATVVVVVVVVAATVVVVIAVQLLKTMFFLQHLSN